MGTGGTKIFQTPYGKPLILILIGILFIGAAVAATSLTIPATTILAGTAVTTSACGGTLALSGGPTPGSGTVRYNCPPSSGAFTVTTAGSDSDRKSTRLNSSHLVISYAVFCLKKKTV